VPGTVPITAVTHSAFNNTNSAKRGLRFTPPFPCRCVGIRFYQSSGLGDFNAILMSDAGSELSSSSTAFEGDVTAHSGGSTEVYFDSPVTLSAGTAYRAVVEPSSATNSNVSYYTLPSADYSSAKPGGAAAMYTSFATATWTDSTTEAPLMDILIDQIDDGASVGGGGGQKVYGG
jgi:hypothetical protein